MKISFEADSLKQFLVEAGIDSNDAKAIVYDLMLASQSSSNPPKAAITAPTPPPTPTPTPPPTARTVVSKEAVLPQVDFETPAPAAIPAADEARSRVRTHKRLNFSQFGGQSTSLKGD